MLLTANAWQQVQPDLHRLNKPHVTPVHVKRTRNWFEGEGPELVYQAFPSHFGGRREHLDLITAPVHYPDPESSSQLMSRWARAEDHSREQLQAIDDTIAAVSAYQPGPQAKPKAEVQRLALRGWCMGQMEAGPGMHWKRGRYPPPTPPGRPAYAQPLSP